MDHITTDEMNEELCAQCTHDFQAHVLVALNGDPALGGIILCPDYGCPCYATWGFGKDSEKPMVILTQDEMVAMREKVQSGEDLS